MCVVLWKVVEDDDVFVKMSVKIDFFKVVYGIVLYFIDMDIVYNLEE